MKKLRALSTLIICTSIYGCASVTTKNEANAVAKIETSKETLKSAIEEAEKMVNSMDMQKVLESSIDQLLDAQIQQNPAMAPFKSVMTKFLSKHMSFESLKPDLVAIYAEAFTAQELRDINKFYQTETGRKTIKLMPELMAKGSKLGMERVQKNSAELERMIREEVERLKKPKNNKI